MSIQAFQTKHLGYYIWFLNLALPNFLSSVCVSIEDHYCCHILLFCVSSGHAVVVRNFVKIGIGCEDDHPCLWVEFGDEAFC